MLTYVLLVYIISNFVFATRTQDIGSEINEGKLTNYLLKPISYFKSIAARDVSDKLLNFGFTLLEAIVLFAFLRPPLFLQVSPTLLILMLLAFTGATLVYFCISALMGFLGFWTTETWGIRFIFSISLDFLAGNFFPIDILPTWLAHILLFTPFPYMFYFPVKIYLGQLDSMEIFRGFVILTIWTILLIRLVLVVWRKGLRVYSAEGR